MPMDGTPSNFLPADDGRAARPTSKPRPAPRPRTVGVLAFLAAVSVWAGVLAIPSCSAVDAQRTREEFDQAGELILSERERYTLKREQALAAGDTEAAAEAQRALDTLATLESKRARAAEAFERVITEDGTIDPQAAAGELSRLLPYPFDLVISLGVGGLLGFLERQRKVKAAQGAAESIVRGIDALRVAKPEVKQAMSENRHLIAANLTPEAKAIVESATTT